MDCLDFFLLYLLGNQLLFYPSEGHEFGQAPEVGDGQGSLACCSPWRHKVLDTTERLN